MEPRTYYKPGHDPVTAVAPSAWRLLEADGYTPTPPEPEAEDDAAGVTVAALEDDDELPFATPLPAPPKGKRRAPRNPNRDGGVL